MLCAFFLSPVAKSDLDKLANSSESTAERRRGRFAYSFLQQSAFSQMLFGLCANTGLIAAIELLRKDLRHSLICHCVSRSLGSGGAAITSNDRVVCVLARDDLIAARAAPALKPSQEAYIPRL